MNIPDLTVLIVNAMIFWNPPLEHNFTHEPGLDTVARYHALAHQMAEAALTEDPLPGLSRVDAGILLASIGSFESGGWRKSVVDCTEGGDSSRSWTAWQLQGDKARLCTPDAPRVALDRLRASLAECRELPAEWRLSRYASGTCSRGHQESAARWKRMVYYMTVHSLTSKS